MTKVACLQLCSTEDLSANWAIFEQLVADAVANGAELICTPENTFYLGSQFHKVSMAETLSGETVQRCAHIAKQYGVFLSIGSMAEAKFLDSGEKDTERCYNSGLLFDPTGALISSYRKIHLFDVDIPGGLSIAESDRVIAGTTPVVVETAIGAIGLSICYDLRFPELYRKLQDLQAKIILIPSAFTHLTGMAHWHTLIRARAIETQSWVIASAQTGIHDTEGKRHSFGHSLIVDPWGRIVADAGEDVGVIYAEIDLGLVDQVRQSIPVQQHRRI